MGPPTPAFVDHTEGSGLPDSRPLPDGYDDLVARLGGGVCVLDADSDPHPDLFFPARDGGSRLYRGLGGLRYEDATDRLGLDLGDAIACLVLDVDQDGDDDLVVSGVGTLRLALREGARFVDGRGRLDDPVPPGHVLASMAAGDVDGDGDVDLVVAGFVDASDAGSGDCDGIPCAVLVFAVSPVPSRLYLAGPAGLERAAAGPLEEAEPTLVVGVADVDGDGSAEVYVGNDLGDHVRDRVLRWTADGLVDVSDVHGMAYDAHGHGVDTMGWTRGDVDGDLRIDVAVAPFAGFHTPLFVCGADGFCEDEGRTRGTNAAVSSFRWGLALFDVELDGDVDFFEATGHVFTDEEGEARGLPFPHAQPPNLLVNDGEGHFDDVALGLGRYEARGIAVADLDGDGRRDVVLTTARGGPVVLRNESVGGTSLRVRLEGAAPNRDAIGARVVARQLGRAWVRERVVGEGLFGSFERELTFGVSRGTPVELEVRWPDGRVETHTAPGPGALTLRERE